MRFIEKSKYDSPVERNFLEKFVSGAAPKNGWVPTFEENFAKLVGRKYAIAVNSATSGLHAALFAADVQPGDEVISPALTVVMDALVTVHMGAVPVFVDVDINTHNINPDLIKSSLTKKTKALIGVSWEGLPCDINRIRNNLPSDVILIDDSAQTLFDSPEKNNSMGFADISVYSFENKKHITTGSEGGIVVTDSEKLAEKIRKFAGIGYKHLTASAGRTSLAKSDAQRPHYLRFDTIGLNYRMSEVSAVIGLSQLHRLQEILSLRSDCAEIFLKVLKKYPKIFDLQRDMNSKYHSYYTIGALYKGSMPWEDFYNSYVNFGAQPFYAAVKNPYLEPAMANYAKVYGWKVGMCPVAENIQLNLMAFKTNYRNLDQANHDASILDNLSKSISN